MRRSLTPWLVFTLVSVLGGIIYRYLADDPNEGTVANYARSAHGTGLALRACVRTPWPVPAR
jgi:hypothetical protein